MALKPLTWVLRCSSSGVRLVSDASYLRELYPSDHLHCIIDPAIAPFLFLCSYFIIPEVKGLSLEQIDLLYRESSSMFIIAFDPVRAVPDHLFKFSNPIATADRCWKRAKRTFRRRRYAIEDSCFGLWCLTFTLSLTGRLCRGERTGLRYIELYFYEHAKDVVFYPGHYYSFITFIVCVRWELARELN